MSIIDSCTPHFIDSDFRVAGTTSSDFVHRISIPPHHDHISVLQASIPHSFYNIQSGLNTFTLTENGTNSTVTISEGNVSVSDLVSDVQTALNTAGSWTYAVGLNNRTGKMTFSVTGNAGLQPSFTFEGCLYRQLGFNEESTYTFTANELTSANIVNLATPMIYISSNLVENSLSPINQQILQEVFTGDSYDHIKYVNPDIVHNAKRLSRNVQLSNVARFQVTNTDQEVLELNGVALNLSLVTFKLNDYYKLQTSKHKENLIRSVKELIERNDKKPEEDNNNNKNKKDDGKDNKIQPDD